MPHRHSVLTVDTYSSSSSDSPAKDNSPKETVSTTKNSTPLSAKIESSQVNYGMFQTVNEQANPVVIQAKEKTTCCDCITSLFFSK